MAVSEPKLVERYARQYGEILSMIETLIEFAETMPAPDEDGSVPCDLIYIADVTTIYLHLVAACEVAYDIGEGQSG